MKRKRTPGFGPTLLEICSLQWIPAVRENPSRGNGGQEEEEEAPWIPSHCGIDGNEVADQLAGEASSLPQGQTNIPMDTCKAALQRKARAEWKRRLTNLGTAKHLNKNKDKKPSGGKRFEEVTYRQLLTNTMEQR